MIQQGESKQSQYNDIVQKYNLYQKLCKESIDKFYKEKNNLKPNDIEWLEKCIKPIDGFLKGDIKAQIFIHGPISQGKSTLINALIGDCILPSKSLETTETIVLLRHDQDLDGKFKLDDDEPVDNKIIYERLDQMNQQKNENVQINVLKCNFQCMGDFQDNPLIKQRNIQIIDKPGADSITQGKDLKFQNAINQLYMQDSPIVNIYLTVPTEISRKSTIDNLEKFTKNQKEKIERIRADQKLYIESLKKLKTDVNYNFFKDTVDNDYFVKNSFCLVVNQKDTFKEGEIGDIVDQMANVYEKCLKGNPVLLVSSLQELQWQILTSKKQSKLSLNQNLRIIMQETNFKRECLEVFNEDLKLKSLLSKKATDQWSDQNIEEVSSKKDIIKKKLFLEDQNESGFKDFVLQMMTQITFQSQQYLEKCQKRLFYVLTKVLSRDMFYFINQNHKYQYEENKKSFYRDYRQFKKYIDSQQQTLLDQVLIDLEQHKNKLKGIFDIKKEELDQYQGGLNQYIYIEYIYPIEQQFEKIQRLNIQLEKELQIHIFHTKFKSKYFKFLPDEIEEQFQTFIEVITLNENLIILQQNINKLKQIQKNKTKDIIAIIFLVVRTTLGKNIINFLVPLGISAIWHKFKQRKQIEKIIVDFEIHIQITQDLCQQQISLFQCDYIYNLDQALDIVFEKMDLGFQMKQL